MKKNKIIYWIATGLIGAMMLFSGFNYFANPKVAEGFQFLGFPDYFRVELGIAKLVGALALLIPAVPRRVKEWAYAGFTFNLISAAVAHIAKGDVSGSMSPIIMLAVLIVSWAFVDRQAKESGSLAFAS